MKRATQDDITTPQDFPTKKTKKHDDLISKEVNPMPTLFWLSFHEMIPDEVLALIFKYISDVSSFSNLMYVNKRFHRVLFSVEMNCFEYIDFEFTDALKMPNFDLVRSCIINAFDEVDDEADDNDDNNIDDEVNNTDIIAVPTNQTTNPTTLNTKTLFPFQKLRKVQFDELDDCSILPVLTKKLNKAEIEHICYNNYLCKELLKVFVEEFPNLKTLEVADYSDSEKISSSSDSVTTFKLNEIDGYATYGYSEPSNVFNLLKDQLMHSLPNLQYIEFQPAVYHVDITQLFWLLTKPVFCSLKKLKIHVTVFDGDDNDPINAKAWRKFYEMKSLPKLELTCEFTHMAILLQALFGQKVECIQVHVISAHCGSSFSTMKDLIWNIFADKQCRNEILKLTEQGYDKYKALISYHSDYDISEENDNRCDSKSSEEHDDE
nr:unnamed protein product [Naegleria fowleri]